MTVLVALGTHAPMDEASLAVHLGAEEAGLGARFPGMTVLNHAWWDPGSLVEVGRISSKRLQELSDGLLIHDVPVRINRAILEHDFTLIMGPVFPHEVVGFSGGNKYLFPGVSGPEMIDASHWLGALLTNAELIGKLETTPVRAMIDEAASLVPGERLAVCAVTRPAGGLHSLSIGDPMAAWEAAASVSSEAHVRLLDAPVHRVLSLLPARYGDLWTGAKGFYKVEPVVADNGQVVIYAPHISEISTTHPAIEELGYHCRDYFVKQWDQFRRYHWSDLAHSTHLRGSGTYDEAAGEKCRVTVTLATSLGEDRVRAVNLDYLDPAAVDVEAWSSDPRTLVVPDAGEVLYRLRPASSISGN
jgi:nickel-dependent lactate racemase